MTALQVLKELKKEKWPELKTGEYNLPLILAAMHKYAELRQCSVSGAACDCKERRELFERYQCVDCGALYIDRAS